MIRLGYYFEYVWLHFKGTIRYTTLSKSKLGLQPGVVLFAFLLLLYGGGIFRVVEKGAELVGVGPGTVHVKRRAGVETYEL